jgi:ferredoxin
VRDRASRAEVTMNILVLLHSTTGNTRLVARYAVARMRSAGHAVTLHDIVARPSPPELTGVDLVAVVCPTMYFRPTIAMERFVARMPSAPGRRLPALLLCTCGGMPGAHFSLLAEWLRHKDLVTLGAHSVIAPSNWPPHVWAAKPLRPAEGLGRLASRAARGLRPLWALFWPDASAETDEEDRAELDTWLDGLLARAATGRLDDAPEPRTLNSRLPFTPLTGRFFPEDAPDLIVGLRIDPERCSRCGTCLHACPSGTLTRATQEDAPTVGRWCTGCFACYNRCSTGAISAYGAPGGEAQYPGPSDAMKAVFAPHA